MNATIQLCIAYTISSPFSTVAFLMIGSLSWDGQQRSWGGPGRNVPNTESSGRPGDFLWLGHSLLLIMLLPCPARCIWTLINNLTRLAQKYVRFIKFTANWNTSLKSCFWSEQKKSFERLLLNKRTRENTSFVTCWICALNFLKMEIKSVLQ